MTLSTISWTSSDPGLCVLSLGASTPVGRSIWATAAAVRAGVSGFAQHPFMVNALGVPMQVASLPWLSDDCALAERMSDALVAAVREALQLLEAAREHLSVELLVSLPQHRPGLPPDLATLVHGRLKRELAGVVRRISLASVGHAGGLLALHSAREQIAIAPDTLCIVAGTDSYLEPDMLEWLEETDQLHGGGERNNAWGFVPGEGAGAVLLAAPQAALRMELAPLARICGLGVARETQLIGTGSVCTGLGLTEAVRGALRALPPEMQLSDVYCDMNGEPYRADEFAFTVARTRERFVAPSDFVSPADCWGDVGAASGPLLIGLASVAGAKRYAKGAWSLVWASSVAGERAAAVVQTLGAD